jgi:hypothetical protein
MAAWRTSEYRHLGFGPLGVGPDCPKQNDMDLFFRGEYNHIEVSTSHYLGGQDFTNVRLWPPRAEARNRSKNFNKDSCVLTATREKRE